MAKHIYQKESITVAEAKLKLEKFCMYQDRCHFDVTQKLNSFNLIQEAKDLILTQLIQDNFLNEERFAKSFARGKFYYKKWGKNKIIYELKKRNISTYNIKSALQEINETDYQNTLEELISKKIKTIKENNPFLIKKKVASYLNAKGYEYHLIYEKLNELL